MKQAPTIVLTGGGSGGHITPLLPLARELKEKSPSSQVIYIGHKGDKFDELKLSSNDFDFTAFVNGGKFRRYHGEGFLAHLADVKTILLNIRDLFRLVRSVSAAYRLLRKLKPDVVFSKGGFVVVPVCFAARLLRIPIITHDSDAVPGLANKIVGRWATLNATGMPAKYYPYPKSKIVYVGIPTSDRIKELAKLGKSNVKEALSLPSDSQILLISGGGNGSKTINDLMVSAAPSLLSANLALRLIHLAGRVHQERVKTLYETELSPPELKRVKVLGFSADFDSYAVAADLVLCRAGATTLAELAALSRASIIMPSPFLAGGHQLQNAKELERAKAAVVIPNEATADELLVVVNELLNNDSRRRELANNLHKLARPNAASELAGLILKVAGKES